MTSPPPEVIDLTSSPNRLRLGPPQAFVVPTNRTARAPPQKLSERKISLAEAANIAVQARAETSKDTRILPKRPKATILLTLHLGTVYMFNWGAYKLEKFRSIEKLQPIGPLQLPLTTQFSSYEAFTNQILLQFRVYTQYPDFQGHKFSIVTAVNTDQRRLSTSIPIQGLSGSFTLKQILDELYPTGPNAPRDTYELYLISNTEEQPPIEEPKAKLPRKRAKGKHRAASDHENELSDIELSVQPLIKKEQVHKNESDNEKPIKLELYSSTPVKVKLDPSTNIKSLLEDDDFSESFTNMFEDDQHCDGVERSDVRNQTVENTNDLKVEVPFEMNTRRTTRKRSRTGLSDDV